MLIVEYIRSQQVPELLRPVHELYLLCKTGQRELALEALLEIHIEMLNAMQQQWEVNEYNINLDDFE